MSRILIVGDSQAGIPGSATERALVAAGHTVTRIVKIGISPYAYVSSPERLNEVVNAVAGFNPDITLYIFGSNGAANDRHRGALQRFKSIAPPKAVLSGPPIYLDPARQALGEALKVINQSVFGPNYLDAYSYTGTELARQPTRPLTPDGLPNPHFTPAGARPWGEAMARFVLSKLTGTQVAEARAETARAQIRAGRWAYDLTEEDRLWAGRAAEFEGGNPAATLWCMAQRYAFVSKRNFPTFTSLLQGYCQPINPRWARGSVNCPVDNNGHPRCTTEQLDRRARAIITPFEGLQPRIQRLVNEFFDGTIPNPCPRAVEFADREVGAGFLRRTRGSIEVLYAGNRYISVVESQGWPDNYVTVGRGTAPASSRAQALVSTTRVGAYAAGTDIDAATVTARARVASREAQQETQRVVLPVVNFALGFDFVAGVWTNQTTRSVTPAAHGPTTPSPAPTATPTTPTGIAPPPGAAAATTPEAPPPTRTGVAGPLFPRAVR